MSTKYLVTVAVLGAKEEREKFKKEMVTEGDKTWEKGDESFIHFIASIEPPIFQLKEVSRSYPSLEFELWYREEYLDEDGTIILIQNGRIKEEREQISYK